MERSGAIKGILGLVMVALTCAGPSLMASAASAASTCDKTVSYTKSGGMTGDTAIASVSILKNSDGSESATYPVSDSTYEFCHVSLDETLTDGSYTKTNHAEYDNDHTADTASFISNGTKYTLDNLVVTFGKRTQVATRLLMSAKSIVVGQTTNAAVTGTPGAVIDLTAIAAPATTSRIIRTATVPPSGQINWPGLKPMTNTRYQAVEHGNSQVSTLQGVTVRARTTIGAIRTARRHYSFQGTVNPTRSRYLVTIYQVGKNNALTRLAAVRTASSGTWKAPVVFSSPGRRTFLARIADTSVNAGNDSVRVTIAIF